LANTPFAYQAMGGGYAGEKLRYAMDGQGAWTIEIIRRSDIASGFESLPRTLSWFEYKPLLSSRCQRLAKNREKTIESSTARAYIASIRFMTRRLTSYSKVT
jgi:putative transposase